MPDTQSRISNTSYIGRFAPSPSGPLHFGSLVCALASYLDARAHNGQWLVRIEDIDPPREQPGATQLILNTLRAHGLHWDGEVLYQSARHEAYNVALKQLADAGLTYRCECNRRRLQHLNKGYDGYCRTHPPAPGVASAIRLRVSDLPAPFGHLSPEVTFDDGVRGMQREDLRRTSGDFVIHRKDGLFAYQLAVVVDDAAQGVTHVVRGNDLLETTARQIYLLRVLGHPQPHYSHIPVVVDEHQHKLSKQNHAPAVDDTRAAENLWAACNCLGLKPPSELRGNIPALLAWAAQTWGIAAIPQQDTLRCPRDPMA